MALADENCVTPKRGGPRATQQEIAELAPQTPKLSIVDHDGVPHLQRAFALDDFASAISFADAIATEADEQDHHPRLTVEWGSVLVEWWTHATAGLHRNDFIMAARSEALRS